MGIRLRAAEFRMHLAWLFLYSGGDLHVELSYRWPSGVEMGSGNATPHLLIACHGGKAQGLRRVTTPPRLVVSRTVKEGNEVPNMWGQN